jgi:predicted house-cleaning noncanonical NTP pyrophosphatase (MazG superfamily)
METKIVSVSDLAFIYKCLQKDVSNAKKLLSKAEEELNVFLQEQGQEILEQILEVSK